MILKFKKTNTNKKLVVPFPFNSLEFVYNVLLW